MRPRLERAWRLANRLAGRDPEPPPTGDDSDILDAILGVLDRTHVWHLGEFFDDSSDGCFFMMLDEPIAWGEDVDREAILDHVFQTQKITRANQAFLDQYGAKADDFLGMTPNDFFAHDLEQGRKAWRELFDHGRLETRTHEKRFNGEEFWVEGNYVLLRDRDGRILGHFGSQRDITAQVEMVEALRRSEARLDEAQRLAHIGHWDWDIETNDLFWSAEIYRIFGLQVGDGNASYQDFLDGVYPDDRPMVTDGVDRALAGEPYSLEHRVTRPDGEVRWVHERGKVAFRDGKPIRMLGTAQDITERKAVERKVAASLHEKEVLLQEIHHRVKNNLQVIKSLLQLQMSKLDEQNRGVFQESMDRVQVMALLHEKLYKPENLGSISVPDYLASLLTSVAESYESDGRIRWSIEVGEYTLDADRAIPFGLLVNEIISNAFKHAFPGGRSGAITVRSRPGDDGGLVVSLADDGVGIDEGIDPDRGSTLGFKLIRNLARQLGATVALTRTGGTCFELTLGPQAGRQPSSTAAR